MTPNRHWILIIAGALSIILAFLGILSYPMEGGNPLELLGYSIGIPLGIIAILLLVYFRGLPEKPNQNKNEE